MTPRDLARFGFLYLNNGIWENKQIIPEKWIIESISMNPNEYGYHWWLFDKDNISGYTAAGSGVSHIYCIPEKDLVVVIASKIISRPSDR